VPALSRNIEKNFDPADRDFFSYDSHRETDKLEGFADDGTVMALATPICIDAIKETLQNFANVSGLKCNMDKSVILPVGFNDGNLPAFLVNSGFPIVEQVSILGITLTKNFMDITDNFTKRIEKIIKIRNFWSRFRLSLQGRVAIAKTFMLSQIGYLGCIVRPTRDQISQFSKIIFEFIKGSMAIAKDRMTEAPIHGGLGMINVDHYLTALQASWIKKINGNFIDNWRTDISNLTNGNVLVASPVAMGDLNAPILTEICTSFDKVREAFLSLDNNILASNIAHNPCLRGVRRGGSIFSILTNNRPVIPPEVIVNLKVNDFWGGNGMKRLDEICESTGLNITLVTYMRIGDFKPGVQKSGHGTHAYRHCTPFCKAHKGIKAFERDFI
jgi:hypothetical protein